MALPNFGLPPLPTMRVGAKGDERLVTKYDLPRKVNVWTSKMQKIFVWAVKKGLLSKEEFLTRYNVAEWEFDSWRKEPDILLPPIPDYLPTNYCEPPRENKPKTPVGNSYEYRRAEDHEVNRGAVLQVGDITLTRGSRVAKVRGWEKVFSPKEYDALLYLMERSGYLCSAEDLERLLSLQNKSKSLDVYIFKLRGRVGKGYIINITGLGWVFVVPRIQ